MSKRVWNPPVAPQESDSVTAWRSVGEKEGSANFRNQLEREFPAGDTLTEEEQNVSRRSFTKLMGASTALAGLGLAACRRPESYIVPYKKAPEWIIPGKPLFYASTRPQAGGAVPLVVTTFEARPTKLEPNTDHPDCAGTDAITQASVLDLYSPARSQKVIKGGKVATKGELKEALAALDLSKTALVFGEDDSPTRNRLAKQLAAKGATLISYEPLVPKPLNKGTAEVVDFSKADRILSLDCDFLGTETVGNSREFSKRRQGGNANYDQAGDVDPKKMNRLYQVETQFSLTGGMADHRLRVAPSRVALIAAEIARSFGIKVGAAPSDEEKKALFPGGEAQHFDEWIGACAADLTLAGSKALVLAGSRQTKEVRQLASAINAKLKSSAIKSVQTDLGQYGSLADLTAKLQSGAVKNVILLTPADPVFDADGFASVLEKAETSIHWGLRNNATAWACDWHVPAAHYLESWGDARTESGVLSLIQPMILPLYGGIAELELLHVLGGGDFAQGEFSPAMGEVKTTFAEVTGKSDAESWSAALKEGFAKGTTYENAETPAIASVDVKLPKAPSATELEIVFASDASIHDGRYIDNAWLQESPDPVTKLTWDNAAQVSPQTAKDLGIYDRVIQLETPTAEEAHTGENGKPGEGENARAPFVTLKVGERELKVPVLIAFGHADNAITLPVGYGQAANDGRDGAAAINKDQPVVGHVGINTGFDSYRLRSSDTPYFATGVSLEPSQEVYKIALTQEHNSMYGRALAREISTEDVAGKGDYEKQLKGVKKQGIDSHAPPNISLYDPKGGIWSKTDLAKKTHLSDDIHQWGMAIDLNTCTGCNACLVACQSENNIPIVGKDQVAMGREMHWIRMDRYFASQEYKYDHGHKAKDDAGNKIANPAWVTQNPESIPQPVACVQCEMAPCETVCPVNATVHTEEGLNSMAYNRCIGTRYCANNCPYKARRFNFFDYNKRNPLIKGNLYKGPFGEKQVGEAPHLQKNPNVSVRMRGVMEKCTYCVQRLESAKIKQKQAPKHNNAKAGLHSTKAKVDRVKDLQVATDSVKTACQEACPTSAISFGNLLNNQSQVVRAKGNELDSIKLILGEEEFKKQKVEGSKRNYDLLNYVNTRPRTSYLARVKNPNKHMPDAKYLGQATINIH
ncbi:TAT-variant-translocated molybdopterin oxidoreductase [Akkermansiaceae bacterium]|nr:TAT-variant-translocated molybdopterin oxidoreductase [Akkermansiaceae bacterium]MDB4537183.1 TAT-variant-translocated molybdopterin oxidoreductase [Akkermansiaceae bacterium]